MDKKTLLDKVYSISKPIADELEYDLYHIEYVKENGQNYLRIYIDKEDGIKMNDCEKLSRRVNEILDKEDFITDSYYFEVSSPGLNRGLFTDAHYKKYIGSQVLIKLKQGINNKKTIKGILKDVKESVIIVMESSEVEIPKDKIKSANLDEKI